MISSPAALLHIFITDAASKPMRELTSARLIAGVGIEGDRYATGKGIYSKKPSPDRQVTLIAMESILAVVRDHGIPLAPHETRRNLITRGVALDELIDRRFRIGEAILRGERPCVPCKYLDTLLGRPVFRPLTDRGGLRCTIETGGLVHPGDTLELLHD